MGGAPRVTVSRTDTLLRLAGRDDLAAHMAAFYTDVDQAVAAHAPVCRNRGDCCKLDAFGHKLYVTLVELAYFLRPTRHRSLPPTNGGECPFHVDGRCAARSHRPLGCRIFFCDPDTHAWQGPEYERRHAELKRIGDQFGVDYRYSGWLSALGTAAPGPVQQNHAGFTGIDETQRRMIN